jgi:predicted metal-binding membrane protein
VFLFAAGYLLVWVGFSAIATIARGCCTLARCCRRRWPSSPRLAGAILIGAGSTN